MSVETEDHGSVRVVRLNRPDAANALDGPTMERLLDALDAVDTDDGVRAVVLTGAGDRTFCAGMDLKAFAAGATIARSVVDGFVDLLRHGIATPLIAAVNGAAVGGGFELALTCDLVVAADRAVFGLPEVRRGLMPGGSGSLLSQRIGLAPALEIGLTGQTIDAARARELGLVNRVVPADGVLTTAIEMGEAIAANGPLAVRVVKEVMRQAATIPAGEAWELLLAKVPEVFGSDDAREGAQAFAEGRPPRFTGR